MVDIAVFAEGPTEWLAVRKLWKKGILKEANLLGSQKKKVDDWLKTVDKLIVTKEEGILIDPPCSNILLLYDQEQESEPGNVSQRIAKNAQKAGLSLIFTPIHPYGNIFLANGNELTVSLHVADRPGPDGNRDFDGYIIDLLESAGPEIVADLLNDNKMTISSLRNKVQHLPAKEETVYLLGKEDIPELMNERGWGVQRSKTLLYSFITATQINKSHVWFSEKVIEKAPAEKLRLVFAPLIAAWDALVTMATVDALRG
ncbi:hypothetical protein GFC01_08475 [Desulfofundulus thermobenzoicus]|uniref:Uncharacterized protein n=1 Tax=Desulfofundulus thermobenzoicus TaxID=29376 RepID=A0A6N7IQJ2_9FIRM|nr:hypothetical protein [Desulfofundulus thermobenzoicus]MQL52304.1 hypothetical protein [Desulfofundulus thermobenzoicus]